MNLTLQPRGRSRRIVGFCLGLSAVALAFVTAARAAGSSVECRSIESAVLGRAVNFCVVLPPDYHTTNPRRYPALYFLHGLNENERTWMDRGGQQILDGLWREERLGPFLVVLPDGARTFYVNARNGGERYEDFLIQELVPFVDREYRTLAQVSARGIGGNSMGGYGALHLGMRHAAVFGSASAHSAALLPKIPELEPGEGRGRFYARVLQAPFGLPVDEAHWRSYDPLTLAENPSRFALLKLYFDCGESDRYGFQTGAQLLHQKLTERGFSHEFTLRPGNHGWNYLSQYLKHSLEFHWRAFEAATRTRTAAGGGP
jgi:S-formylglutathione hydrolase FrmB